MTPVISERALILAPQGRDSQVARAMLGEADLPGDIVADPAQLVEELRRGAGFAVVTEEALTGSDLHPLSEWLAEQPQH